MPECPLAHRGPLSAAEHGFEVESVKQRSQTAESAAIGDIEALVSGNSGKIILIQSACHMVQGGAADVPGVVPRPAFAIMGRLRDIHVDITNRRSANAFSGDVDHTELPVISARSTDGTRRSANILEQVSATPHYIGEGFHPLRPGGSGIFLYVCGGDVPQCPGHIIGCLVP